jgi:replication fork clamp-binding protein CrfC
MTKVSTIEFSLVEVSVMHGLKSGNEVLKEIHKELNIESVEKLLDETREAQAYQKVSLADFANALQPLNLPPRKSTTCSRLISQWTKKKPFKQSC